MAAVVEVEGGIGIADTAAGDVEPGIGTPGIERVGVGGDIGQLEVGIETTAPEQLGDDGRHLGLVGFALADDDVE